MGIKRRFSDSYDIYLFNYKVHIVFCTCNSIVPCPFLLLHHVMRTYCAGDVPATSLILSTNLMSVCTYCCMILIRSLYGKSAVPNKNNDFSFYFVNNYYVFLNYWVWKIFYGYLTQKRNSPKWNIYEHKRGQKKLLRDLIFIKFR